MLHLLKSPVSHNPLPPGPHHFSKILMIHSLDGRGRALSNYFHLSLHFI